MTRSAYAGLQRYTFGWTNDSGSGSDVLDGWAQMENQVAVGISAGLGGIPFWTTDISGYCGDITGHLQWQNSIQDGCSLVCLSIK